MTHPLVSIVLATYNGEKFLHQQLDSLIKQTYKNIEIIIVDDCSTDKTIEIIDQYKNQYSFIQLYKQEKNVGYIKNFEKGLNLVLGEWVAICDQDDIWQNNKLEIILNNSVINSGYYHDSNIILQDGSFTGKKISDSRRCTNCTSPFHYAIGTIALGHTMVLHKNIIKKSLPIPENMPYDAWLGFISTIYNGLFYIDLPLVNYRQHQNNLYGAEKNQSIHNKERKKMQDYNYKIQWLRYKLTCMGQKCNELDRHYESIIFFKLAKYTNFGILNSFYRAFIYFKFRDEFLIYKKRNNFRKILYSIKMLFKRVS